MDELTQTPEEALPGDPGLYRIVFRSGWQTAWGDDLISWGETQLDAALRASVRRDALLRSLKKEGEGRPHDKVLRSIFVRADGGREAR